MPQCYSCNQTLESNQFHRQDSCLKCHRDTHVCKNCIHYDRAYNNECKESSADRVVDKEKSNFCDYFSPSDRAGGEAKSVDQLKAAADALFKKK